MRFQNFLIVAVCGLMAGTAQAIPFTADITDPAGGPVLFKQTHTDAAEGEVVISRSTFANSEGKTVFTDEARFKGEKLLSFKAQQFQLDWVAEILINGDEITFKLKKEGKEKSDGHEKLTGNFVVPATLVRYMAAHQDELRRGESVDIRMGVPDRQETVGFTLKKVEKDSVAGSKLVIQMKASNFVIAQLVDPITFVLDESTRHMVEMRGRTPVKTGSPGAWKDFDGLVRYHFDNLGGSPAK